MSTNSAIASLSTIVDSFSASIYDDGSKYFQSNSNEAGASATGTNAIAAGAKALASGENATAIGYNATASAKDSMALGTNSKATAENSVALGAGSIANQANTISVGSAGNERRITNVAAGTAPTDAVNVSQLQGLGSSVLNEAKNYSDSIGRKAYSGIAMAMAQQAAQSVPGKFTYAMSVGVFQNQTALGLNVRRTSDTGRYSWSAGVSGSKHGGAGGNLTFSGTLD